MDWRCGEVLRSRNLYSCAAGPLGVLRALRGDGKKLGYIMDKGHPPQVGAVDPELRTSPILDDEQEFSLDLEIESGACYFNGVAYPIGQFVLSGNELLHCEGRGLWVRKGEMRTD
jgi:hypothetical protein